MDKNIIDKISTIKEVNIDNINIPYNNGNCMSIEIIYDVDEIDVHIVLKDGIMTSGGSDNELLFSIENDKIQLYDCELSYLLFDVYNEILKYENCNTD